VPPPPPRKAVEEAGASLVVIAAALGILLLAGAFAPPVFVGHLTVFVLACFIGWQVVWNVTPALHTPLMSVTNAVSGIILVGGMLQISGPIESPVTILSAVAVLIATINISGGFLVTQRMLKMFQR
jgi:NAD(P) transhydrogenase subunit alpha